MTPLEFLQIIRRRWVVLVALLIAALVLTVGTATVIPQHRGVYWSRTSVIFIPTSSPQRIGNALAGVDPSVIYFAAAVERAVGGTQRTPRLSSSEATLYGAGIRSGYSLSLRNAGGQWRSNFNQPTIVVEVVGSDPELVRGMVDEIVDNIRAAANQMQAASSSDPAELIRTEVVAGSTGMSYVAGSRVRASVGAALLGLALSLALTVWVDGLLTRIGSGTRSVTHRRARQPVTVGQQRS